MKKRSTLLAGTLTAGIFLAAILILQATSPIPPPSLSDNAGAWIGYGKQGYIRLELDKDGTGYLAMAGMLDPSGRPIPHHGVLYRVTKWKPEGYRVVIELEPVTEDTDRMTLNNEQLAALSPDMELSITRGKAKYNATLYREDQLLARSKKMKEGIRLLRK